MREQSRPRHLSLHNNGHVNNIQRNWTCGTPRSCAQCALSIANAPVCRGTGSEAPPTFRAWTAGTCRAWSQRRQPPRKVKLPIICTPHWAGGEPNWAVSPGVVGADHPSVSTATPTPHVPPTNATVVLAVSQSDRERDGHLHQLFHHLRLGKRGARRGMAHEEPGHPGGLPGLPAVSPPSAARRCGGEGQPARSPRSAPRCAAKRVPAEQTQQTACLAATRRQAHLRHQGKRTQCLPPGGWDAPERGRVALLDPTPWPLPSSVSVELSGAFSARDADGLLFVSVPRTQPPLSSSLRSSHHGLPESLSHELSVNCAQTSTRNLSAVVVDVVVVVVVEWLYYSTRIIIVRKADLSEFFR